MTPTPDNAPPTPEKVDDSNPHMRALIAQLAATLPPQVAAVEERVDRFAGLAADLVALAGGDRKAAETMVAEAAVSTVDVAPPVLDAATETA